ncbi:hypothetical protein NLC35_01980 [Candidatus Aminicenantes bacterium AC-334-K16]|nr:hypothetical protein [Candidatus Aminicenantes bacterium AC-334-K16]
MKIKQFSGFTLILTLMITLMFVSSCTQKPFEHEGWKISVDSEKETLKIEHELIGLLLKDMLLFSPDNQRLSDWKINLTASKLTITTNSPQESTWTFLVTNNKLQVHTSLAGSYLLGTAPADEERIPARTEEEDNGIVFTSLGFISARNIHSLFDIPTDTMIKFSSQAILTRNEENIRQMDVKIKLDPEATVSLVPDYYLNVLGLKYYQPRPKRFSTAPVGWCSWYCYYMGTTEEDMIRETDALARLLKPYGLEIVQLDACYTRGEEANYLEWNKEAFPRGGKWLFEYIRSKGLKPGLWVNVYGSNYAKPECAEKYPENFYLRDKEGNLSGACCTADKTVVRLDYSNPEVIEKHLKPMLSILKNEWGLVYLKDAGWGTWMDYYDQNREQAFDSSKGSREIYVEVQQAVRKTLGDDVFINGCAMHEVGLCFGLFDGSRTGGDDKAIWYPQKERGMSMQTFFHSLFGANYLNNIVWFCDPDVVMVRNPLTYEEGQTIVSSIALTGQTYMASDFMDKLPTRKLELYRKTMPTTPIKPVDLYPFRILKNKRNGVVWCCPQVKEFPRAIDLKVNGVAGDYDVLALFNWKDEAAEQSFSLEELGLDPEKEYHLFNFWEEKYEGTTSNTFTALIPPHGTLVLIIKEVKPYPQLLSTSRHITSTISLNKLNWNPDSLTLNGTSSVVSGDTYSLFIWKPSNLQVTKVEANTEVLFHREEENGLLEVKFSSNLPEGAAHLTWNVIFKSVNK